MYSSFPFTYCRNLPMYGLSAVSSLSPSTFSYTFNSSNHDIGKLAESGDIYINYTNPPIFACKHRFFKHIYYNKIKNQKIQLYRNSTEIKYQNRRKGQNLYHTKT
jgi:hypothetical protein